MKPSCFQAATRFKYVFQERGGLLHSVKTFKENGIYACTYETNE